MIRNVNASEIKGKIDIGIITIREDEYEAILQRFPTEQFAIGHQTYSISTLTTSNNDDYVVASVRCPEQGNLQGQAVAHDLIDDLDPQLILLVGIAGSVPDYEYTLGDVILASRLHDFNVSASIEGKDQQTSQQFSATGGPMHPTVQRLIGALPAITICLDDWNTPDALTVNRPDVKVTAKNLYGDSAWQKKVRECVNRYFGKNSVRQLPKVFSGSVASSDTLVKNTQLVNQWLENSRQIKGIEMELAGVYQAAWGAQKPVLAIRGISDIVGFKRSPDWTTYACHSAASFAEAFLRFQPIPPIAAQNEAGDNSSSEIQNKPVGVFKQLPPNFTPIKKAEKLYSNLITITHFPDTLYSVPTECKSRSDVWTSLRQNVDIPPYDWVYTGKMIYAFHDFSDPIWKDVCVVDMVEKQSTKHWADSQDNDRISEFIDLLSGCLKELAYTRDIDYIHKPKVGGVKKSFKYLCYAPTLTFSDSPLFQASDFQNISGIVEHLKDEQNELAAYLYSQLSDKTQELVNAYPESTDAEIAVSLTTCFNKILKSSFYNSLLLDDVYLRKQTLLFRDEDLTEEEDLMQLNRMYLEDIYKDEIVKKCFSSRTLTVRSLVQSRPRDVFRAYHNDRTGKFRYYRHNAFRFQFMRIAGNWCMEITPTYHYTWDGHRVFKFYEDEIKGIKRLEDNEAVFRQVMFWSRILKGNKGDLLEQYEDGAVEEYDFLKFGDLIEFPVDYGVNDDVWRNRDTIVKGGRGGSRRGGRSRKPPDFKQSQSGFLFS